MKINDVTKIFEAYGAPGSRALGAANFALLSRHYTRPGARFSRNLKLDFGNGNVMELDDEDVEAIAKYYDSLPADADRYSFVYDTMSRIDKFTSLLRKVGRREEADAQAQLWEDDSKKKSQTGIDRTSVRSAALNTALKQAFAKYPSASSDIEALIMHDLDYQKDTDKDLQNQTKTNRRQDKIDTQIKDIVRKQSAKISTLDQENDDLTSELDRLSQEVGAGKLNVTPPTQDDRAEKRSQSKEKRKADADNTNQSIIGQWPKPTASMPPLANPVTKPNLPTIDILDQPKPAAEKPADAVTKISIPKLPASIDTVEPVAEPTPAPANNVFQFPGKGASTAQEPLQDEPDPRQPDLPGIEKRTGTNNESKVLGRMKELAGLDK